jgi:stress response protein YsnF
VVGEVAVGKQVEECEETVKDTVRRTEMEVEEVGAKPRR